MGNKPQPVRYIDRATGEIREEKIPGRKMLVWLYYSAPGKFFLHALVKRKAISRFYGWYMDRPSSKRYIPKFINDLGIDTAESEWDAPDFPTFNDFFIRKLHAGRRPIDDDENSVASPADGKISAWQKITREKMMEVKGQSFTLDEFLGSSELAALYDGGSLCIVRVTPADYHRFHFPVEGLPSSSKQIKGCYHSVSPLAVRQHMRTYCENKREYTVIDTETFGKVLMCEVGATGVGSIIQTWNVKKNDAKEGEETSGKVKKGAEKGYFKFGGSSVALLFEKGRITFDEDILENTKRNVEVAVRVGERLGVKAE